MLIAAFSLINTCIVYHLARGVEVEKVRALIVDDHSLTRVLLTSYLETLNAEIVGHVALAREAMELAFSAKPNLAVLDLDLGLGPTGIDLAHGLRRVNPKIAIVMLTSYEDPRLLRVKNLDLPRGAVYLGKKDVTSGQVLADAILLAMANADEPNPGSLETNVVSSVRKLSDSQIEIMRLVAAGLSNARIAEVQYLTESAVGKAIARLIRQLDIAADKHQNQRVLIAQAYYAAIGPGTARRE
jgi:two-component system nitrate/nitrite response regulator NarL